MGLRLLLPKLQWALSAEQSPVQTPIGFASLYEAALLITKTSLKTSSWPVWNLGEGVQGFLSHPGLWGWGAVEARGCGHCAPACFEVPPGNHFLWPSDRAMPVNKGY